MWLGVIIMALGSLAVAEVGRRAAADRLAPNHLVGIRVPATLDSEQGWSDGHRAAGPILLWTGVVGAVVSVLAGVAGSMLGEWVAAALLVGVCIELTAGVVWSGRRASEAAQRGSV